MRNVSCGHKKDGAKNMDDTAHRKEEEGELQRNSTLKQHLHGIRANKSQSLPFLFIYATCTVIVNCFGSGTIFFVSQLAALNFCDLHCLYCVVQSKLNTKCILPITHYKILYIKLTLFQKV